LPSDFSDVDGSAWYADSVRGVLRGSDGMLLPQKAVTRAEAAAMLMRYMGISSETGSL